MTTQNNILETMLKYRQKTSVSKVNVFYVLKFNSTVAGNFTNNTYIIIAQQTMLNKFGSTLFQL